MIEDPSLKTLSDKGDPLEKIIVAEKGLLSILLPYSRVWKEYIFPYRIGNGTMVEGSRMAFSGQHYTALIRLHHAFKYRQLISSLAKSAEETKSASGSPDYSIVLDLHAATAAFWENIGSAIDNLNDAISSATRLFLGTSEKRTTEVCQKCNQKIANANFKAGTAADGASPKLAIAFERRNQFIHSIIVPLSADNGMITFNLRHWDDSRTEWHQNSVRLEAIEVQIEREWDQILIEFAKKWERFFHSLGKTNNPQPIAQNFNLSVGSGFGIGEKLPKGGCEDYLRPSGTNTFD